MLNMTITINKEESVMSKDNEKKTKRVPKRLRKYRMDAGYSIYSLADRMEVNYSTISYWENGVRFPRPAKMMELEDIFGATHRELFEDLTEAETAELERRMLDPTTYTQGINNNNE